MFLRDCLVCGWIQAVLSLMDLSFVYKPQFYSGSEWFKIKVLHLDKNMNRPIHQNCPLSPLLYVLALEPFLCRLRVSQVLGRIRLPDATTPAR